MAAQYAEEAGATQWGFDTRGTCARLSRMHFRRWGFLFAALWLAQEVVCSQVPPAEEIYSRFGVGKPGEPIAGLRVSSLQWRMMKWSFSSGRRISFVNKNPA